MTKRITRRDFLDGVVIGTGLGLLSPAALLAQGAPTPSGAKIANTVTGAAYYPPTLTGMRGSHEGSFEVAHALAWRGEKPTSYEQLDEHYDLVVVGAGMSGLAAALFYRQKMGDEARILILDNHDDFGGHAKRNEFHQGGRMVLSLGGAQNLENPESYSEEARGLLADLGIDETFLEEMSANTPDDFVLGGNLGATSAITLPRDDQYVTVTGPWTRYMMGEEGYEAAIRQLPFPVSEQDKLISLVGGDRDYLEDLSLAETYSYINTVSYNRFLTDKVGLSADSIAMLDVTMVIYYGFTGWNLSVLEALTSGSPGFRAIGWTGKVVGSATLALFDSLVYVRMFPDGNASIARLLVHKLVPGVASDMKGVEDVATAKFHYDALDREGQDTRIRLNSTVVGVRETAGARVEVDYVAHGRALRVSADHCILACYNGLIPHLCPKLPEPQKDALKYGVKVPFVYANVLLKDGQAFSKLGATMVQCPGQPFVGVSSAPTISVSGYEPPRSPADPMAVFMMAAPTTGPSGEESLRDLLRIGRIQLYSTPFASYEKQIRDQLQSLLGEHGFNNETDILAITVNRIPHGYAYEYMSLEDPEWPEGEAPNEVGRAQFGRISIANSDAEARAYMDAAFDAAWRAVQEQTA